MRNVQRTATELRSLMQSTFADAVAVERLYQDRKWGGLPHDRDHTWPEWHLILQREMGEVSDMIGEVHWKGGDPVVLRTELVQVAAVCAAMIEVIDAPDHPAGTEPEGEAFDVGNIVRLRDGVLPSLTTRVGPICQVAADRTEAIIDLGDGGQLWVQFSEITRAAAPDDDDGGE